MEFKRRIFLVTLFIVGVIFLLGLLIGFKLDEWRADDTYLLLTETKVGSESYAVENSFIEEFGLDTCAQMGPRLNSMSKSLVDIGSKLNEYDLKKMSGTEEFDLLKRRYFLSEITALTLNKKLVEECGESGMVNIIYFYQLNQEESLKQGYVLDKFVRVSENVHIFSFDLDFDEPAVETLKNYYNVESSPTVILDFKDNIQGYVSFGELIEYYNSK